MIVGRHSPPLRGGECCSFAPSAATVAVEHRPTKMVKGPQICMDIQKVETSVASSASEATLHLAAHASFVVLAILAVCGLADVAHVYIEDLFVGGGYLSERPP